MASRLLGPHSTPLHDDVAAYAFSYLDKEDRKNLACVNKRNREFITTKYPKYDRTAPKYKELTTLQKLELEFIKFQDRPVWERVCIVALCVLLSPAILAYHSPSLLEKFYIAVIDPCARSLASHLEAIAITIYDYALTPLGHFTYDYVLVPFAQAVRKIAVVTYDYVLTPLGNAIYEIAKFIFVTFPTHLYESVLHPLASKTWDILILANEHILTPLARAVQSLFTGGLVRLLHALYTNVLEPTGRVLWEGLNLLYDHLLVPLANFVSVIAQGVFITFPTKAWNHVIGPAMDWTLDWIVVPLATKAWEAMTLLFHHVVVPIAELLGVILEGVCITFPSKIYVHILSPIGGAIGRLLIVTYEVILTPLGQMIQKVALAIFNELLIPMGYGIQFGAEILYTNVLSPVGMLIMSLPSLVGYAFSGKQS